MELYTYHSFADATNVGTSVPFIVNNDVDDDRNVAPHEQAEKKEQNNNYFYNININQLLIFKNQFTHLAKVNFFRKPT